MPLLKFHFVDLLPQDGVRRMRVTCVDGPNKSADLAYFEAIELLARAEVTEEDRDRFLDDVIQQNGCHIYLDLDDAMKDAVLQILTKVD